MGGWHRWTLSLQFLPPSQPTVHPGSHGLKAQSLWTRTTLFSIWVFLSEQHKRLAQLLTTPAIQPQKWCLIGEIKVRVLAEILSKQETTITTQAYLVLLRASVVPAMDLSPIFVNYTLCKIEWGWITAVKLQENPSTSFKTASSQVLYFSQASSKQLMLRYWSTEPSKWPSLGPWTGLIVSTSSSEPSLRGLIQSHQMGQRPGLSTLTGTPGLQSLIAPCSGTCSCCDTAALREERGEKRTGGWRMREKRKKHRPKGGNEGRGELGGKEAAGKS